MIPLTPLLRLDGPRRLLLMYAHLIPLLYSDNVRSYSLEHIVSRRVLRTHVEPARLRLALKDPHNIHLACTLTNNVRSDFRFVLSEHVASGEMKLNGFKRTSGGVLVCEAQRMFVPRVCDFGPIARAALYCDKEYGVDARHTVVGGRKVAEFWASELPITKAESTHFMLSLKWHLEQELRAARCTKDVVPLDEQ